MRNLNDLRLYFHRRKLNKQLKSRPQAAIRQAVNLETAATVGILFDATELKERNTALKFAESLEKRAKKVKLLGFFDNKMEGESFPFPFYTLKDLDWTRCPLGEEVKQFLDQKFDLLFVLRPQVAIHMEYIAALAYAHLKVGPCTEHTYCFDLMIDADPKQPLSHFISQAEQLLKQTNVKKQEVTSV
jgi:hypothetical protein